MRILKSKVIVIVGPTASGKTSIKLAKELNGEIISADSMQIYKEMNIGTAKPSLEERDGIKHYLMDIVSPEETFNVTMYKKMAEEAIEEILSHGKLPIIVGGTGLYVSTLINGIEFSEVKEDVDYRKEMQALAESKGPNYLHDMLKEIDPIAAENIDMNNVRRVIRALEIYKVTGKTKTQLDKESIKETLYDRINLRVDKMLEEGLIEEVKTLLEKYKISKTAFQGLGYKEVKEYLDGQVSYEDMIEKLKMETRRYAKRQLTWFRREKKIKWLSLDEITEVVISEYKK